MVGCVFELESSRVLKFFATYAAPQHAAPMHKAMLHAAPQHVATVWKALLDLELDLDLIWPWFFLCDSFVYSLDLVPILTGLVRDFLARIAWSGSGLLNATSQIR